MSLVCPIHCCAPSIWKCCCWVAKSWPTLQLHGLQLARLPCPSPSPKVSSNSCSSSRWCHPTITLSVVPFSVCPPSFPAAGSLPIVGSLHQVAKILELQLQHQSFQWKEKSARHWNVNPLGCYSFSSHQRIGFSAPCHLETFVLPIQKAFVPVPVKHHILTIDFFSKLDMSSYNPLWVMITSIHLYDLCLNL